MIQLVAPLLLSLFLVTESSLAEPVKLGVLTDLSAGMASWGTQSRIGAEMAQDEIRRAGGDLILVFGDHQLTAKNAVGEIQRFSEFDKIDAAYVEFTPAAVAIAPISNAKKIPIIYSSAAISPLATSPYMFKSFLDFVQGCRLVAEEWKRAGIAVVGSLKVTLEFGELCLTGSKQVFPNIIEVSYSPGDDVSTQTLVLKKNGVQGIMNVGYEADFIRMLRSLKNIGWSPKIAAQDNIGSELTLSQFPDALSRAYLFSLPTLPAEFIKKVKDRNPQHSDVSVSAAGLAYLHVKQLYEARIKCQKSDADCMVREIGAAKEDKLTGFGGWHDRIAKFDINVRSDKVDRP